MASGAQVKIEDGKGEGTMRDAATAIAIVLVVGLVDYATGYEISFSVVYVLAIWVAVWKVGWKFALCISALSVASWLGGDWAAGARYPSIWVAVWNGAITMMLYAIVVWLLWKIRRFQATLEARVEERTEALREEITERERLEQELLEISDREQRRFGHDLHDGLCQHLLGAAIAAQVLVRRLGPEEARTASEIVGLIEEGVDMARNMAHGLSPLERGPEGLTDALGALAATTREFFKVECVFDNAGDASVPAGPVAMQLYRIVQEAISNAIRHGKAKRIVIALWREDGATLLRVRDDGGGLPPDTARSKGMGLRIMKHRAGMMGAECEVSSEPGRGVTVTCRLPEGGAGI